MSKQRYRKYVGIGKLSNQFLIFKIFRSYQFQLDKAGQPYILHPLRVMLNCDTYDEKIIAVLHDVVEDTSVTLEVLKHEGFPLDILSDIQLLTKTKGQEWDDFIAKIKTSPRATKIKLLDMQDNSNLFRLQRVEEKHLKMVQKYHRAVMYLLS